MGSILQSAFLKALGWSLIDSLWQMGIVWVLYLAITRSGKKFNAETRHNLSLLSLATGSGWFLFTLFYNTFSGHPTTTSGLSEYIGQVPGKLELVLPWISVLYLFVASILVIRLYRQLNQTKKLSSLGLRKAAPEIRVFLQQLAGQMGIKKEIRVWISELVETPLTIGFWKPVILLPVSIINNLSLKQTESIILHELYHIQRNDFVMNLLVAVADIILFFNPFARFFRDVIQKEREHRCDDMVLQYRYDPALYAQALLMLEKQRPVHAGVAAASLRESVSIAATGTHKMLLFARVKRMLTGETAPTPVSHRLAAYLLPVLILGYLGYTGPIKRHDSSAANANIISDLSTRPRLASLELPQLFATERPLNADPVSPKAAGQQEFTHMNPALAYQNEFINIERDLAEVIITKKVEELVTERARAPIAEYVTTETPLEYTISITDKNEVPAEDLKVGEPADKPYPYVPGSSFLAKPMADSMHGVAVAPPAPIVELQLARSLNAIDEMDWHKIEESLVNAGEDVDIERLQAELKRAVEELDWKSLNTDIANAKGESAAEVQKYRRLLAEKYLQLENARTRQDLSLRAARQKNVSGHYTPARPATKSPIKTKKKIVDI